MKKRLIIIAAALIFLSGSGFFYAQQTTAEKPISKSIDVQVYKTASYVSPAYANTTATLEVTVVRVKNGKRDTAWQHSFQPTELKDYPTSDKPLTQKITIPNVNDKKETLEVYYKVSYNTQGSILNSWNATLVDKGQKGGKLQIKI